MLDDLNLTVFFSFILRALIFKKIIFTLAVIRVYRARHFAGGIDYCFCYIMLHV